MARRNIPITQGLSRQDIVDAIAKLSSDILDPNRPSLLSSLNEHRDEVQKVIKRMDEFIEKDYTPFKTDYYATKNKSMGYLAGAGLVGGGAMAGVWAIIKTIFKI